VLGFDDEDPGRPDHDVVDVGPRAGHRSVVEDEKALRLQRPQDFADPFLALSANAPGVRAGWYGDQRSPASARAASARAIGRENLAGFGYALQEENAP
jgi:hypothetical protein